MNTGASTPERLDEGLLARLPDDASVRELMRPFAPLLDDTDVTELVINRPQRVLTETHLGWRGARLPRSRLRAADVVCGGHCDAHQPGSVGRAPGAFGAPAGRCAHPDRGAASGAAAHRVDHDPPALVTKRRRSTAIGPRACLTTRRGFARWGSMTTRSACCG